MVGFFENKRLRKTIFVQDAFGNSDALGVANLDQLYRLRWRHFENNVITVVTAYLISPEAGPAHSEGKSTGFAATQVEALPLDKLEDLGEALLDFGLEADLQTWLQAHSSSAVIR